MRVLLEDQSAGLLSVSPKRIELQVSLCHDISKILIPRRSRRNQAEIDGRIKRYS